MNEARICEEWDYLREQAKALGFKIEVDEMEGYFKLTIKDSKYRNFTTMNDLRHYLIGYNNGKADK